MSLCSDENTTQAFALITVIVSYNTCILLFFVVVYFWSSYLFALQMFTEWVEWNRVKKIKFMNSYEASL